MRQVSAMEYPTVAISQDEREFLVSTARPKPQQKFVIQVLESVLAQQNR